MAFNFEEARAMIEEAKKRGLIRAPGSADPVSSAPSAKARSKEQAPPTVLPDWLQNVAPAGETAE